MVLGHFVSKLLEKNFTTLYKVVLGHFMSKLLVRFHHILSKLLEAVSAYAVASVHASPGAVSVQATRSNFHFQSFTSALGPVPGTGPSKLLKRDFASGPAT